MKFYVGNRQEIEPTDVTPLQGTQLQLLPK
jgi:hypothetical protein